MPDDGVDFTRPPRSGLGGIEFERVTSDLGAPASVQDAAGGPAPAPGAGNGADVNPLAEGAVMLHPAVIKLPFMTLGKVGRQVTGWPGWEFEDEELAAIVEAVQALNITMTPMSNAIAAVVVTVSAKALGYMMWLKAGKPGGGPALPAGDGQQGVRDAPPA